MFDAHLHLQDERFDACRDDVIAAALAAGVTGGCCCGSAPDDWDSVAALADTCKRPRPATSIQLETPLTICCETFDVGDSIPDAGRLSCFRLLPAFGVHPWHAGNLASDWLTRLETILARQPQAPVGEIGIDGLRDHPPRDAQRQVLCAQLELAAQQNRPVVLHGARAWGELLAIIEPFASRLPGFVVHAFGGSHDILRKIAALGGYVSFAGTVCNPAARHVRAAAAAVPPERLLIETDAPDMKPGCQTSAAGGPKSEEGIPQEINHPANLVYVARAMAELRGATLEDIAMITTANARRVYRLAKPA